MGYVTHARGEISIVPPLAAAEIKGSPFLPEAASAEDRDVMFRIEEERVDTNEGTLTKRRAVAIVQTFEDEPRNYNILEHVTELVRLHGEGHHFLGHFEMEGDESGDIWRVYVADGKAVRVDPVVTWPDVPGHTGDLRADAFIAGFKDTAGGAS